MNLPVRSFSDFVRDMSAAINASAGIVIDISVGSIMRAIIESNAAVAMWVQWLIALTLQTTRAATSAGSDLDSWMADFSLTRLSALPSVGLATFTRYSGLSEALIPDGTAIKTSDGAIVFVVTANLSHPAWQQTLNSYSMAVGLLNLDLPIVASVPGTTGNVQANTITLLATATPGIDAVTNSVATSGGCDPETDDSLRQRFGSFLAARSRGTVEAIEYAVSQVRQGLKFLILDNLDAVGNFRPGNALVIVDDGSGGLSFDLLSSLSSAIMSVRSVGVSISIQPSLKVQIQVDLAVSIPSDVSLNPLQESITWSIAHYLAALSIGAVVSITRISQVVYEVDSRIINISSVKLNGQGDDIVLSQYGCAYLQSVVFH